MHLGRSLAIIDVYSKVICECPVKSCWLSVIFSYSNWKVEMELNANNSFMCTFCDTVFGNKYDLNSHMTTHFEDKKHVCSLCGKKFFSEKSLDLHITIHATEMKYEGLSTSSEEHMMLSNQASSLVNKHQGNKVPQVKVRVKSFPANANIKKVSSVDQHQDKNVMHFQLSEEEFDVVEESEVYTTPREVFQEMKPVQLKVWSKDQNVGAAEASAPNLAKVPYVIKVLNESVERQKDNDSDILKMNSSQNQQPIRIFVGSNIRIENNDASELPSQGSDLRCDDLTQVRLNNEQIRNYGAGEDVAHQEECQQGQLVQNEMVDDDLHSLQEEMDESDLQSLREEMEDDYLKPLQENIKDGTFDKSQEVVNCQDVHLPRQDMDNERIQLPQENIESDNMPLTRVVMNEENKQLLLKKEDEDFTQPSEMGVTVGDEQFPHEKVDESKLLAHGKSDKLATVRKESGFELAQTVQKESGFEVDQPLQKERGQGVAQLLLEEANDSVQLPKMEKVDGKSQTASEKMSFETIKHTSDETKLLSQEEESQLELPSKITEPLEDKYAERLKKHVMRSNERPHKCQICGLGFRFSFYLKAHMSVHSNDNQPYNCAKCNKNFKTLESYERHQKAHINQSPLRCNVCFKECPNTYQVKRHMDTHNCEKQYECALCHEKFHTHGHLRSHLKTHTVHKCYICDKAFKEASKLKRHIKSHLNKKLYRCKICNRTLYCHPNDFQRHETLHQSVISCPKCFKDFLGQHQLQKHLRKCHQDVKTSNSIKYNDESIDISDAASESSEESGNSMSKPEKPNENKVRSKVAELLIDEILKDISEEDMKESTSHYATHDWLEKVSEGMTKEKFMDCISDCSTKGDLIREISFYLENDIIKDAVSDCLLSERIAVQRLSQMMGASELIIT